MSAMLCLVNGRGITCVTYYFHYISLYKHLLFMHELGEEYVGELLPKAGPALGGLG